MTQDTQVAEKVETPPAAIRLGAESEIVARMAEAEAMIELGKTMRERARLEAIALYEGHGLAALNGDAGTITITQREGAARIDVKLIRELVDPKIVQQCTVIGEPGLVVALTLKGKTKKSR